MFLILVNSEGFAYARYAAYLSGARTLALMNRYPSLRDFCVQMDTLVDKYVQQAVVEQEDGGFTLPYSDLDAEVERRVYDEDIQSAALRGLRGGRSNLMKNFRRAENDG